MGKSFNPIRQISGIYKIICINNKFYIGSSVNIDRRLKDHVRLLKNNKHINARMQSAWNKYGEKNFRFEIIETIHDISQLSIKEKEWIDDTNCCDRKIGFNISSCPTVNGKRKFNDIAGQKFNNLNVIKQIGKDKHGNYLWLCLCDCGNEKIINGHSITSGHTKSCGCLQKEKAYIIGKLKLKHGHCMNGKISRTYIVWQNMLARCFDINNQAYKDYGGRGITVCDRWLPKNSGFKNFLKDIGEIPKGLTLDRIDNNKLINSYSKKNCRLVTAKEQSSNRRNTILILFEGEMQSLKNIARKSNVSYNILYRKVRINKQPIEGALADCLHNKFSQDCF